MEIKTKFNINDRLYYLKKNRITDSTVFGIVFRTNQSLQENILTARLIREGYPETIEYLMGIEGDDIIEEKNLFISKDELIKSL